jgi:L-ascorbate metabolism protein UlaG (beta-lactamase superfamily)
MQLTYYGHSSFGLSYQDEHILLDPFISPNELAKGKHIMDIPANYILLSHGHEDHIFDCEAIAKDKNSLVVANFEIISWLSNKGITHVHPMNIGGKKQLGAFSVKMVNAIHSSCLPDGSNGGNPSGFVISVAGKYIYYSGDTALHYDMKIIAEQYKIDVAILCIGGNFTMDAEDAVVAAKWLNVKNVVAMHFDTFPYIAIQKQKAQEIFTNQGIGLQFMEIGSHITL